MYSLPQYCRWLSLCECFQDPYIPGLRDLGPGGREGALRRLSRMPARYPLSPQTGRAHHASPVSFVPWPLAPAAMARFWDARGARLAAMTRVRV